MLRILLAGLIGLLAVSTSAQEREQKFFSDGSGVSYERIPSADGYSVLHIAYDRTGMEIWRQDDQFSSISISSELVFHPSGGLKSARTITEMMGGRNSFGHAYSFDEQGRMLSQETFENGVVSTKIEYRYDQNGRRSEVISCNPPRN